MLILFGLLVPVALVTGFVALRPARSPIVWAVAFVLASSATAYQVIEAVRKAEEESSAIQVTWRALSSPSGTLQIGGAPGGATIAWPTEIFFPVLHVIRHGETADITIEGAEGFVGRGTEWISGEPVQPAGSARDAAQLYSVAVGDPGRFGWILGRTWLEIRNRFGQTIVSGDLPSTRRARVLPLDRWAEYAAAHPKEKEAARAVDPELLAWARDRRILLDRSGAMRIVSPDLQTTIRNIPLPIPLQVLWRSKKLDLAVSKDGAAGLRADFAAPWHWTSRLPKSNSASTSFVITDQPLPGDIAFTLPIGNKVPAFREAVTIRDSDGAVRAIQDGKEASTASINLAGQIMELTPSRDLSHVRGITIALILSIVITALGLLLAISGIRLRPAATLPVADELPGYRTALRIAVFAVVSIFWTILVCRMLLAVRYALAPEYIDSLSARGLVLSFTALVLAPAFLCAIARISADLWRPPESPSSTAKGFVAVASYLIVVAISSFAIHRLLLQMWPNLMARYFPHWPIGSWGIIAVLLLVTIGIYVRERSGPRRFADRAILGPFRSLQWLVSMSDDVWLSVAREGRVRVLRWVALVAVIAVAIGAGAWFAARLGAGDVFREFVAIFVGCWIPVFFWTAVKGAITSQTALPASSKKVIFWGIATILAPVVVVPLFIRDVGAMVTTLAIFLSLFGLMLSQPMNRVFAVIAIGLASGLLIAFGTYLRVDSLAPHLPGAAGSRILVLKHGSSMLGNLLEMENDTEYRDAFEHQSESKLAAHLGAFSGKGFNAFPSRRSPIRQDTLQFDSVYSFFITSEHGLIGGVALIVLCALPFLLLLSTGRSEFHVGWAVATLITSSYFFEAIFHAMMNLGLAPFTGRDFPLLAVNSPTDIVRWPFMFAIAIQALFWTDWRSGYELRSVVSAPEDATREGREVPLRYVRACIALLLVPALAFLWFAYGASLVAAKQPAEAITGWKPLLDELNRKIKAGEIKLDERMLTILPSGERRPTLVEREIARFNSLPLVQRIGGSEEPAGITSASQSLTSYDAGLRSLLEQWKGPTSRGNPTLFRLERSTTKEEDEDARPGLHYALIANSQFDRPVDFEPPRGPADVLKVEFRSGRSPVIIGPAWVMGRWRMVGDPRVGLPWVGRLARALDRKGIGSDVAKAGVIRLTLDRDLQNAAEAFAAEKGRSLHRELLALKSKGRKVSGWPPRVGICVISIPDGEVLALGSWPRMTSARVPQPVTGSDADELAPPESWLDRDAPAEYRVLYTEDHNFDRVVVGSATKPFWAAAALEIHPAIRKRFVTWNSADSEDSEVFGIPIKGKPWHVSSNGAARDFDSYLQHSDNRYEVRLGFLTLAEAAGSGVAADGRSLSRHESMDGGRSLWKHFPRFAPIVGFSDRTPDKLQHLDQTEVARQLQSMFGIISTTAAVPRRRSLWFGKASEQDAAFDSISPEVTSLQLDDITKPRQFVSILLGGLTNRWANIELASAFATAVTGRAVVPRIIAGVPPDADPDRSSFVNVAQQLEPALSAVVMQRGGTAYQALASFRSSLLTELPGVEIYAKTGTLAAGDDTKSGRETSRFVVALIRWKNKKQGTVAKGLAISIYAQRATLGRAPGWANDYIIQQQRWIREYLR